MYQGKHGNKSGRAPRRPRMSRTAIVALALVLVLGSVLGGTLAYLFTNTGSIKNTFTPAKVTTTVTEEFDNKVKNNVQVKNTGDISAYIRAMVVVTWQDDKGNVYATAPVQDTDYEVTWSTYKANYTIKNGWLEGDDGFYYYPTPVEAEASTTNLLTDCKLKDGVTPPDGYHLVVEILAEAIQAEPTDAVTSAWGVTISTVDGKTITGVESSVGGLVG